jgi:hypothetical protein
LTTEPVLDEATVTSLLPSNALLCCADDNETDLSLVNNGNVEV